MTEDNWADMHARFATAEGLTVKYRVGSTTKKKVDGKYPAGTKGQMLAYIDARAVMDRLDDVAGPGNWEDRYHVAEGPTHAVECILTVLGVTRCDVGYPNAANDDASKEPLKAAYSDAFKRAAVKFGIGRFLYDLESDWVEIDEWGKAAKAPRQQQQRPAAQPTRAPAAPATSPKPVSPERRELLDRCKRMAEHARAAGITPPAGITRDSTDAQLEAWHDALAEQINAAIQTELKELDNAK